MKVFMCIRQGGYSGGLAIVAANSREEAFKTFFEDDRYLYLVDKYDLDTFEWLGDATQWRSSYYPLEMWFECKHLTANVDLPCVIMEDGYSE